MFNWDTDVEDLYSARPVGDSALSDSGTKAGTEKQPSPRRGLIKSGVVPAALVAGALVLGGSLSGVGPADMAPVWLGNLRALVSGPAESNLEISAPPAELIAYGPVQYRNFMAAIANFSDLDLLQYAQDTARQLENRTTRMTPFLVDVLFLSNREIRRRRLRRPDLSTRIIPIQDE